jgi:hypothetical protein
VLTGKTLSLVKHSRAAGVHTTVTSHARIGHGDRAASVRISVPAHGLPSRLGQAEPRGLGLNGRPVTMRPGFLFLFIFFRNCDKF